MMVVSPKVQDTNRIVRGPQAIDRLIHLPLPQLDLHIVQSEHFRS
jgi:hypothetical protein